MIVNPRVTDYIRSLEPPGEALAESIAGAARAAGIPVICEETAALLKALITLKRPGSILEVGTAVGYSALLMCRAMPPDCRITTIEMREESIRQAGKNFRAAGVRERITLLTGDAGQVMRSLAGPYDFIFMDAAKGQYIRWLPAVMRLLAEGGVLLSDNVLRGGDIVESRYAVERRDRTIHGRMREYLFALKHMEELETSVIPIGDGAAVSVRKVMS